MENIGGRLDDGILSLQFLWRNFAGCQAPHILCSLTPFNQPNVNKLIHLLKFTTICLYCQAV